MYDNSCGDIKINIDYNSFVIIVHGDMTLYMYYYNTVDDEPDAADKKQFSVKNKCNLKNNK